ncbi:MAG: hypothetical protein WCF30_17950 [Terracidiphilus sp.]
MQNRMLTLFFLILATAGGGTYARAKVVEDTSGSLRTLTSIADALDSADRHPVHILYVHGMNEVGAGDSWLLRKSICTKLKLCEVTDWKNAGAEFPDEGEFAPGSAPPALDYLGTPIWNNAEEWRASAPFVVHWVVHLRGHRSVLVVDEMNWWPLVLALKCRRIVANEAYLAGLNRELLQTCSQQSKQDPDGLGHFFPWISPDEAARLAAIRPHAVLINRTMKDDLIDWGFSDVAIVVGQIGGLLRDGLRQLMEKSASFDANEASAPAGANNAHGRYDWRAQLRRDNTMDQEFIGVTHSLGAYLLFNTLNVEPAGLTGLGMTAPEAAQQTDENSAVRYIFERTLLCYFFANQLELLEITNLDRASDAASGAGQSPAGAQTPTFAAPVTKFRALVQEWVQLHANFQAALHPNDEAARKRLQVVAWSDPNDILTWRVSRMGGVDVVNLYVQNAVHWLWLFESPSGAHGNYAENKAVLRVMFQNSTQIRTH